MFLKDKELIYTYKTINQVPKSKYGDWFGDFKYEARGYLIFILDTNGICPIIYDKDYYINLFTKRKIGNTNKEIEEIVREQIFENDLTNRIYDKIDGKDFLQMVYNGSLIDYDGTLCAIYVDGYKSNLGLNEAGIHQGDFKVTGEVFEKICNNYNVWVNWANK